MNFSSEFLELFFKSSAIFIVSIPGVFHVTQKHLAAFSHRTPTGALFWLAGAVPERALRTCSSWSRGSSVLGTLEPPECKYVCVVFRNLCGSYFLGPKCLIWIFHVFSMQRSCSPACPDLKYEHTWGDDLWIWDLWMCKDFYLYLKYLSKNLTSLLSSVHPAVNMWPGWLRHIGLRVYRNLLFPAPHTKTKLELKILFEILLSLLAKVGGFPWFWSRNVPLPTAFLTDAWVKYT